MSYNKNNFDSIDIARIENKANEFKYSTTDDSLATVGSSGYFNFNPDDSTDVFNTVQVGDFILVKTTSGNSILSVASLSPVTTAPGFLTAQGHSPIIIRMQTAANATNNDIFICQYPYVLTSVVVIPQGAGHAGDTITIRKSTTNITNAVSLATHAAFDVLNPTSFNTGIAIFNVGDTISALATDGGGSNIPSCIVTISAYLNY